MTVSLDLVGNGVGLTNFPREDANWELDEFGELEDFGLAWIEAHNFSYSETVQM